MEPIYIYKIIHIVGLALTMLSFGSLITKYSKCGVIGHGVGLLMLLVSGFGLQARVLGGAFPGWLIVKLVLWLVLGGMLVLVKRGKLKAGPAWLIILGIVAVAAFLALTKPF